MKTQNPTAPKIPAARYGLIGLLTLLAIGAVSSTRTLHAEPPAGLKRAILFKQDSSIPGHEAIIASVELAPGAAEGRHTHHADLYGYVLEGSATIEMEGSPTVTLHAGEVFYVPAGVVHQGLNNGSVPSKVVALFVADKGQALTTPVK